MKLLISCLEPSANLHLNEVLKFLPNTQICGIFDKKFGKALYDSSEFLAMGFLEVLPLIFKAKKAIDEMAQLSKSCDSALLIDSSSFNLRLAKAIKKANKNCKITYYILPQVWAWKPKRVKEVEANCDNLASILPFDSKFYTKAIYVGHPLLDEIKIQKSPNCESVAFLPGSRRSEISKLLPIYKEVAKQIDKEKILVVPSYLKDKINEIYGNVSEFSISFDAHQALAKSEFAFICSGTATLEAALIGTPFVLCYKAKAFDIWLAKKLVKLKHIGLANIMFDFMDKEELNKEFIQEQVTPTALINEYKNCDRTKFISACNQLREYLKYPSAAKVAKLIMQGDLPN